MAVRKRAAVPALATKTSSGRSRLPALGIRPPSPVTLIVRLASSAGSGSTPTSKPSLRSASTMPSVSSHQRAPRSVVLPSARAARMSALFVMLFDPGMVTRTGDGLAGGTTSTTSGSAARGDEGLALQLSLGQRPEQRLGVALLDEAAQAVELVEVAVEPVEDVVAVGQADVVRHLRRAGGEAREVVEGGAGHVGQLRPGGAAARQVEQGDG